MAQNYIYTKNHKGYVFIDPVNDVWRQRGRQCKGKVSKAITLIRTEMVTAIIHTVITIIINFVFWKLSQKKYLKESVFKIHKNEKRKGLIIQDVIVSTLETLQVSDFGNIRAMTCCIL